MHRLLTTLLFTTLLGPSTALAGGHEVNLEVGMLTHDNVFSPALAPRSFGVSGGWAALSDARGFGLALKGSWHRTVTGASFGSYGDLYYEEYGDAYNDEPFGSTAPPLTLTYLGDSIGVGAKADYDVAGIFFPYVEVRALLHVATVRVDADASQEDNLNQVRRVGASPGISAMGGFELALPRLRMGLTAAPAIFVEGGYTALVPVGLGDFGRLRIGGATLRSGIGVRF